MQDVIDQLRQFLPPIFLGSRVGELTGGAIHWPTIQNKRSLKQIPDDCFIRSGQKIIVRRDPFLDWWSATLSDARQGLSGRPQRSRGERSRAANAGAQAAA